jgi:hypothetical protein
MRTGRLGKFCAWADGIQSAGNAVSQTQPTSAAVLPQRTILYIRLLR